VLKSIDARPVKAKRDFELARGRYPQSFFVAGEIGSRSNRPSISGAVRRIMSTRRPKLRAKVIRACAYISIKRLCSYLTVNFLVPADLSLTRISTWYSPNGQPSGLDTWNSFTAGPVVLIVWVLSLTAAVLSPLM
jgi:hypothetical protein